MRMAGWIGSRKQKGTWLTAGGVVLAAALALAGCSRSGTLSGDVVVRTPAGEVTRGARMSVYLVVSSEAFEREWAETVAAFRTEVAPAVEAQKAAEYKAQEARLAWDRALADRGKNGGRSGRWTIALRAASTAGSSEHWKSVRATEGLVFQARKRVWEIVSKYEEQAHALVQKHAAQRVQTDESGHYVLVKVPTVKVYVYARLREKKADFIWFVPLQIEHGTQQADLTQESQRRWSFVP